MKSNKHLPDWTSRCCHLSPTLHPTSPSPPVLPSPSPATTKWMPMHSLTIHGNLARLCRLSGMLQGMPSPSQKLPRCSRVDISQWWRCWHWAWAHLLRTSCIIHPSCASSMGGVHVHIVHGVHMFCTAQPTQPTTIPFHPTQAHIPLGVPLCLLVFRVGWHVQHHQRNATPHTPGRWSPAVFARPGSTGRRGVYHGCHLYVLWCSICVACTGGTTCAVGVAAAVCVLSVFGGGDVFDGGAAADVQVEVGVSRALVFFQTIFVRLGL